MNEELRDRLAKFLAEGEGQLWDDVFPRVPWEVWAEQVLAEIEAAGYRIVKADQLDRVTRAAGNFVVYQSLDDGVEGREASYQLAGLEIGDLVGFDLTEPLP